MHIDLLLTVMLYVALLVGLLYLFFKPAKLYEQIHLKRHDSTKDR